jgi:hypothetical protein
MKLSERLAELNAKGEYPGIEEIEVAQRLEREIEAAQRLEWEIEELTAAARAVSAVEAADLQGVVDE